VRRLDIGVASYGNAVRLRQTLASIEAQSATDWRCFVIHNPGAEDDAQAREVVAGFAARNNRFIPIWMDENVGYAGAIQKLFSLAETEYIAYCDNDIQIHSRGWDEAMCALLDRCHEVGMVFPNGGAYQIQRGSYQEIMWGVGFCWVLSRLAMVDAGPFDTTLGHQEEADYCLRVRMAGYRCAAMPEVRVAHCATATSTPAAQERISRGVVNWVNKWNVYFNGKNFHYHSPNVTRWEDWPPNALYLEEYWLRKLPELNNAPSVIPLDGREYDLIQVPRLSGFYRGRII
jgi:GT2 family glycosyltransferase